MTSNQRSLWNKVAPAIKRALLGARPDAACRRPRLPAARPLALEQRFMFDAAAVAATADAAHAARPEAARRPRRNARCRSAGRRHAGRRRPGPRGHGRGSAASRDRVRGQPGQDYQQLVAQVRPGAEVIVLDKTRDGLQQIADAARPQRHRRDPHHRPRRRRQHAPGLGGAERRRARRSREPAGAIGAALTAQGDILLYGCDIGANARGAELLSRLAQLTHAGRGASNDRGAARRRLGAGSGQRQRGDGGAVLRLQRPLAAPPSQDFENWPGTAGNNTNTGDRRSALRDQQHRHHRRDQCGPTSTARPSRLLERPGRGRSRQQF